MKEKLKEYYEINIEEYKEYNDGIIIFVKDTYYYFFKTDYDKDTVYYIHNIINKINIKLHDFIYNKDNDIYSDGYILLKLNYLIDDVNIYDIKKFNIKVDVPYNSFKEYVYKRIDYIENNIKNINNNDIIYSIDYYVGICEILMKYYNDNRYDMYLCHKKLSLNSIDFYNPLNIIFDYYLRDIASYYIISNNNDYLFNFIGNLSEFDKYFLYCRLVIPFEYFDALDGAINGNNDIYLLDIDKYNSYVINLNNIFGYNILDFIKKE